jgi:hypothetical protein
VEAWGGGKEKLFMRGFKILWKLDRFFLPDYHYLSAQDTLFSTGVFYFKKIEK